MTIIQALRTRKSKQELSVILNEITERAVRKGINRIRKDVPVISMSEAPGGYRLAMRTSDYTDSKRTELELRSRIRELNLILKPLIVFNQLVECGATDEELAVHFKYEDRL